MTSPHDGKRSARRAPGETTSEASSNATASAGRDFEDLSSLLSIVGHELRGPLNQILGWAQLLQRNSSLDASAQRAAEAIVTGARQQERLLTDILEVSRLGEGLFQLDWQVVNLSRVVNQCVTAHRPAAQAAGLTLTVETLPTNAHVRGDRTRLAQIVSNLVGNAIKFTEFGQVRVCLQTCGEEVILSVTDTGRGVQPELLDVLFRPFVQADVSASRSKGGLGLGLAIVRDLAAAHGGSIVATSEGLGRGSEFTVRLPLTTEKEISEEEDDAMPQHQLSNVHVLVVDDDPETLALLREITELAGARVSTATSAAAALRAIDKAPPDVLVSDVGLPDRDGLWLLSQLRTKGLNAQQLPALALTGYASREDAAAMAQAGFQLQLTKPVEATRLVSSIASLVHPLHERSPRAK